MVRRPFLHLGMHERLEHHHYIYGPQSGSGILSGISPELGESGSRSPRKPRPSSSVSSGDPDPKPQQLPPTPTDLSRTREHPASEVYVTGTFDDWSKSEKLVKTGDHFAKEVTLPSADEKIYYKVRDRTNTCLDRPHDPTLSYIPAPAYAFLYNGSSRAWQGVLCLLHMRESRQVAAGSGLL
jgi:hypothetical protein